MVDSDAETVLGEEERGEEDSPMSPCVWTAAVDLFTANKRAVGTSEGRAQASPSRAEETALSGAPNASNTSQASACLGAVSGLSAQDPRRELLLSPASQLNVLSQISELADVQSRQSAVRSAVARPVRPTQRAHAWAPAADKRKSDATTAAVSTAARRKKKKKTQKTPPQSQAERLAVDMLDWATCSEGELFEADTDDTQSDWVYEDISDTDFEE